jgi:hypothetical protein
LPFIQPRLLQGKGYPVKLIAPEFVQRRQGLRHG